MAPAKTIKSEDVSIVSAIETLSSIADLELSSTLQDPLMISPPPREAPVMMKAVRWLHKKNAERMMTIMRDKLHVVLNYLRHFYASERGRFARKESIEGIRTIMMLVDEASENLDRYTKLFLGTHSKSIKQTKEFVDLCSFYNTKIAPIAVHRKVAAWISALPIADILAKGVEAPPEWSVGAALTPLSLELEDIQRDRDYELLLIRKANGARFFTPKLLRSMRLACDIEKAVDWQGRAVFEGQIDALQRMQTATVVNYLLNNCYPAMDAFFRAAHRAKDHQLVLDLYSPCIALMMSGIQAIHYAGERGKNCVEYLDDFRSLLGQMLHSSEFKRLLTYPPNNERSWEFALLRLVEQLASNIVDGAPMSIECVNAFTGLLNQGMQRAIGELGPSDGTIAHRLNLNFAALRHLIGTRGATTIVRMLQELEMRRFVTFEPLLGESLPTHLFNFSWRGELIPVVRLPSPTRQEKIDAAFPSEVFQIATRRHGRHERTYLVLNLQERTGWKDGARCQAIEELQREEEGRSAVSVFSLSCDGDFYRQEGSYEAMSSAEKFKEELVNHLTEPSRGVQFPRAHPTPSIADIRELIDVLHTSLYGGRNRLPKAQRLEWIDLMHLLLMLKVIEQTRPSIIFVSCKDGLDSTLPAIAGLFSFLKVLNRRLSSEEEMAWLGTMLLGIPLIERDRLLFADRYSRLTSLVRLLESGCQEGTGILDPAVQEAITKFLPQESSFAAMVPASGRQPTHFDLDSARYRTRR